MRLAAWLVLLTAPAAHAEKVPLDAWYPQLTAGVGIGYRAGDLAILSPQGADLALELGIKLRPQLFVDATVDYAPATARNDFLVDDVAVTTTSAQLALRQALMSFGDVPRHIAGDMFVTGGVAREWIAWDGGGMQRTALVLGGGTTLILPSTIARQIRAGFRMQLARAPDPGKRPAGCDGPCDTPTATTPYDMSIVMEVSCHLGH